MINDTPLKGYILAVVMQNLQPFATQDKRVAKLQTSRCAKFTSIN